MTTPEARPAVDSKAAAAWLYGVGALLSIIYASDIIPALSGKQPGERSGGMVVLFPGVFFYLWWNRLGRKGWQGFLIGSPIGLSAFVISACVAGFMRRGAV